MSQQQTTGYEAIQDLGDVEVAREPLPRNTLVTAALTKFALVTETDEGPLEPGHEYFEIGIEVLEPEECEGHNFTQRAWLGNTPKAGAKSPMHTGFHMTRQLVGFLISGILQVPAEKVSGKIVFGEETRLFFSGIEIDPSDPTVLFRGMEERMQPLLNMPFDTKIGLSKPRTVKGKDGQMVTYAPRQEIGYPQFPVAGKAASDEGVTGETAAA